MDGKSIHQFQSPQRKRTRADIVGARELEEKAEQLENAMCDVRRTLAEMLPNAHLIHAHFVSHRRNSIVFRSCRSWTEYCSKRLHCTPDAIFMAEKRMRIKELAAEQAKEAAAVDARQNKRFIRSAEFARAQNKRWCDEQMPDVAEPDSPEDALDLSDDDRVVPLDALVRTVAALDEGVMTLTKIISGGILTEPDLLAEAKKCVAHLSSIVTTTRSEFDICKSSSVGDLNPSRPKVVSIEREQ
jgi:hypothetical protein